MKLPHVNTMILTIACIVGITGILCYFLVAGTGFRSMDPGVKGTTFENITSAIPPMIDDASFDIQEANVSVVKYINITHVTYDQL